MSDRGIDVYINDHLAGAMLGTNLAEQIRDRADGALRATMDRVAKEIGEDHGTLTEIADELGVSRNPVKQATGWLAEKASQVKFSGAGSGEPDHGLFMALESLRLGVAGKKCLWIALRDVTPAHPELTRFDFDLLIERATAQEETLEQERRAAGRVALGAEKPAPVAD